MEINREEIFSVTEVSNLVKNIIDANLPFLWIEGEVSNYVAHSSGHIYFSLKDNSSVIRCACFRQYNRMLTYKPKNGEKVISFGKIDVYEKTGTYQLIVRNMLPAGIGELQVKYLALKNKLEEEGLFSKIHKKALPLYPEKVGVITSPTGAAIQDIINVVTRRYPHKMYLFPAAVQGDSAIGDLITGIEYFNKFFPVDLIIIGRGGGSQEDLFCFNDERLARAIFSSKIPIISAVGHEIDFTISDFVADVRAPTPSAAAEIVVPNKEDLADKIRAHQKYLCNQTEKYLFYYRDKISYNTKILYQWHPRNVLYKHQQRLDEAIASFNYHLDFTKKLRQELDKMTQHFLRAINKYSLGTVYAKRLTLDNCENRIINSVQKCIDKKKLLLESYKEQLMSLSPQIAMQKGYALIRKDRNTVKSVYSLNLKDRVEIIFIDGTCQCIIEEVKIDNSSEKN